MAGMQFYGKKVCFIGAHPDDIELGCGALIARISGKTDVRCVTFSNNQKNPLLKNLVEEHYASMQTLGVPRFARIFANDTMASSFSPFVMPNDMHVPAAVQTAKAKSSSSFACIASRAVMTRGTSDGLDTTKSLYG